MRVVNIIPTYNEKENIKLMIEALKAVARKIPEHRFFTLVVDDNSPDGTGDIVLKLGLKDKNLGIISAPRRGLGEAMIRGIKYAIKEMKAEVIVTNEADFAFDPSYIIPALEKLEEGYEAVIGSRHVFEGRTEGWSWSRRLNHWIANTVFATWISGVRQVHDHNGAFRVIKVKNILEKMNFEGFPSGFAFFNYWMFRIVQKTNKIYELPIVYRFRTAGESKISFNLKYLENYLRDVVEYIIFAFKIRYES